jgi:hypothetical protein
VTRLLFSFYDVLFGAKALKICDYSCVITIYTLLTTLYVASFRTPTSSYAS